jgi:hypothetical protein
VLDNWLRKNRGVIAYAILALGLFTALVLVGQNGRSDDRDQTKSNRALLATIQGLTRAQCEAQNEDRAGTLQILTAARDRSQIALDADRDHLTPAQIAAREANIAATNALIEDVQTNAIPPIDCEAVVARVPKQYKAILNNLE